MAYELLGVDWVYEVPGHEPVRIPLEVCADGSHNIWFASLSETLSAGAQMLAQITGGFVIDALAECCPPTLLAGGLPTELADPDDGFTEINEEVIP
jgi:hypothetical protein